MVHETEDSDWVSALDTWVSAFDSHVTLICFLELEVGFVITQASWVLSVVCCCVCTRPLCAVYVYCMLRDLCTLAHVSYDSVKHHG